MADYSQRRAKIGSNVRKLFCPLHFSPLLTSSCSISFFAQLPPMTGALLYTCICNYLFAKSGRWLLWFFVVVDVVVDILLELLMVANQNQ